MGRDKKGRSWPTWVPSSLPEGDPAIATIVFIDISDSTKINHDLGDEAMGEVRDRFFARGYQLNKVHQGWVVKMNGDNLIMLFRSPIPALDLLFAFRANTGHPLVTIHGSIHVGQVIRKGMDIFGETVNYAARLEGEAQRGEILVSQRTKEFIESYSAKRHKALQWHGRLCELKGFEGPQQVWAVSS